MKISNNALNFLLAQYRAIFKRAYVKGIASAVLLTAGLAAGQAQADAVKDIADINASEDSTLVFDGTTSGDRLALQITENSVLNKDLEINTSNATTGNYIKTSGTADANTAYVLNGNGHNISITGKGDADEKVFTFGSSSVAPKLQITNLRTLTIDGAKVNLTTPKSGSNTSSNQVGVDVGANNVIITNGAQVNLNNNTAKTGNKANAILRGLNMEISGEDTVVNIGNSQLSGSKSTENTKAVLGWARTIDKNGTETFAGSDITVNGATLNMYGAVVKQAVDTPKPALGGSKGYAAQIQGKTLNMTDATLHVFADHNNSGDAGAYGGAGGTLNVWKSTLTNSYLTIDQEASLNLEMREFTKDYKYEDSGYYSTDKKDKSQARDYNGYLTIDGGVVVIDGALRHTKGGLLEIKDGTKLTGGTAISIESGNEANVENKLDNAILLGTYNDAANPTVNKTTYSGAIVGSFGNSTIPSLRLSSTTLDQFLNSTDEEIKAKNGDVITDNQGQIIFHHGARMELTDNNQVEMSKFVFDNDAGAGHISTTIAASGGTSTIDITLGNPYDPDGHTVDGTRTIMAKNMSIGQSLLTDPDHATRDDKNAVISGNSSLAFRFEANDLTLGSERGTLNGKDNWDGFDSSATSIGANELKAHKSITFVDGKTDKFVLKDSVVLDTTLDDSETVLGSADSSNTGTLNGDDIVIGNDTTSGSIAVKGGAWSTTQGQDITITSGSLTISAQAGEVQHDGVDGNSNTADYYSNGVGSSLTMNGGAFVIGSTTAGSVDNAKIEITGDSGATAFLDLRDTSVTWNSGSITVKGNDQRNDKADPDSYAGEGILFVRNNQFNDFINGEKPAATQLTLGNDGVLAVDGSITGEIDVSKFGTGTADTAGKVFFSGEGTLTTDGALTIAVAANDEDGVLAIGDGTIEANQLTLNNHVEKDESFVVSGGTLEVAQNLSSNKGTVEFKVATDKGGILVLDREGLSGAGTVGVDLKFDGAQSKLDVDQGEWNAAGKNAYFTNNATFSVGDGNYSVTGTTASLSLANLNTAATSPVTSNIYQGSTLTVDTMQAGANSVFAVNGEMTINGRSDINSGSDSKELAEVKKAAATAGINLAEATFNVTGTEAALNLGTAATDALISFKPTSADPKIKEVELDKALSDAKINLTDFARLNLEFSDAVTSSEKLTAANAQELKDALNVNGDVDKGIINVGNLALAVNWTDEQKLIAKWDDVKEFANVESVTSDQLQQALITDVTGQVAGHFGAMQTSQNAATAITVDGTLGLHAARGDFFAFTMENGEATAVGMQLNANSHLLLEGAGQIGAIAGSAGANSDVTIAPSVIEGATPGTTKVLGAISNVDDLEVSNNTTVAGNISANYLGLDAGTSLTNMATGSAGESYTTELASADILTGAQFSTQSLTLQGESSQDTSSWIMGTADVAETLRVDANSGLTNEVIVAGGSLSATDTVLAQGVKLLVGLDANTRTDTDAEDGIDETASYTGAFETQTLDLNGGLLKVDPDLTRDSAFASVARFVDGTPDSKLLGTIDGSLFVGRNSILGLGSQDLAELRQIAAKYQVDGKLSGDIKSIAYLDGITSLAQNEGFVMTALTDADFTKRLVTDNKWALDSDGVIANTIYFGAETALVVTADALGQVGVGTNPTALITIENSTGTLVADGGEILISGDLRGSRDYTLFADQGTDTKVNVVDIKNQAITADNAGIKVSTENGVLEGWINNTNGGVLSLEVADDARARLSGASDPVYDTLIAYFNGYNSEHDDGQGNITYDYIGTPTADANGDGIMDSQYQYSNYFLAGALEQGNGSAAEAAARLGVYGGAPQAAIKAGQSSTDAIAARFGIGSAISNLTVAGNTQGAALWLAPVYKTSDSDGFDAQGVDYGVNVDLYGVALGADYTLANGISFGAMFNVGSGEVDGEGAASPVSNDFDYYGFGAYAGYTMGQFSVVGDISYTVADNEVEASTSVDHIGAQMDSTNLSVGVTGKYELSFNGVNVTPHVGLRYSNIDLDDYTIDGEEVVASADSDKLNLFSIPVGVTIAKEFKGESWTVAPSFDLTLTGQFGDDELDGSVSWAGVSNLTTDTTTEVFDNFTYGATLGVEAQSVGGIALGINVGYTGSSNVDEFGVNANARFVF